MDDTTTSSAAHTRRCIINIFGGLKELDLFQIKQKGGDDILFVLVQPGNSLEKKRWNLQTVEMKTKMNGNPFFLWKNISEMSRKELVKNKRKREEFVFLFHFFYYSNHSVVLFFFFFFFSTEREGNEFTHIETHRSHKIFPFCLSSKNWKKTKIVRMLYKTQNFFPKKKGFQAAASE
jgi:hypothetical protein